MIVLIPKDILEKISGLGLKQRRCEKYLSFVHLVLQNQTAKKKRRFTLNQEAERREIERLGFLSPAQLSRRLLNAIYREEVVRNAICDLRSIGVLFVGASYRKETPDPGGSPTNASKGSSKIYGILSPRPFDVAEVHIAWTPKRKALRLARNAENGPPCDALGSMDQGRSWVVESLDRVSVSEAIYSQLTVRQRLKRFQIESAIVALSNRDFRESVDDHGRLHHLFTNCPKELRACLLLDGDELAELDLKAAHIFFLLTLLPRDSEEASKLHRLLVNEDLYSTLSEEGEANERLRKKSKRQLLTAINGTSSLAAAIPEYRRFKDQYPILVRLLEELKSANHKVASHFLQKLESGLMFESIVTQCPPATIRPRHDDN